MPHQCVKCSSLYEDGAKEILTGCSSCGGKFFFFMKKKDVVEVQGMTATLTEDQKEQIEQDAMDLIGENKELDKPVILDLESIRMLTPGKFEIDLVDIFKGNPLVYKLDEGKYVIDIASTFEASPKKNPRKKR